MMPAKIRVLGVFALALGLSACEYYKLEEIHRVEPTGTPFQKALAQNYRALSMAEQKVYDWSNAVLYAGKSLESAYGHDVMPETLAGWDIPDDVRPQMEQAHEGLLALLSGNLKEVQPQRVADAQTFFDCWVEQQDEGWQTEDIAYCREEFYAAMAELTGTPSAPPVRAKPAPAPEKATLPPVAEEAPAPLPAEEPPPAPFSPPAVEEEPPAAAAPEPASEPIPDPAPAPEAKKAPPVAETASYIVFFNAGESHLSDMGEKIVDNAADTLKPHATYRVIINSHTDTYGGARNPELPIGRAQAVRDRLILQGIEASSIEILAKEGDKPAEDTLSSAVPVERKIEIFISE